VVVLPVLLAAGAAGFTPHARPVAAHRAALAHTPIEKPVTLAPRLERAPIPSMLATEISAGVLASTGALAWLFPGANLASFKEYDSATQSIVRAIGAWQLCFASVLLVGKRALPVATVAGFSLFYAAGTIFSMVPVWDTLGREKSSQVAVAVLFALLGKLSLAGRVSPYVAPAAYLLTGTLIYATPKSTAELYQLTRLPLPDLASSVLSLYGASITYVGVYLAAIASGLAHPAGLAMALCANVLASLRWAATEATKLEVPKAGPLLWAAISAALAGMSVLA